MELQSTSRPAVTTEIIGQLQRMIHDGVWPVGSRIPTERVLGEELGVGRGTVREAIGALAYAGVLEVRRGDGTYVASLSELTGSVRRLRETSTGMGSLLEVRGALDVLAARLAAARHSQSDLEELRSATAARDAASADAASWIDADWHFHLLVAHASRNPLLIELYRSLETTIRDEMIASWGEDGFSPASPIGHADLVEAIADGDGERAGRLAQSNLDETSRWAG